MENCDAQQTGMLLNSAGEEITVTQGTDSFPQAPGNDLPSNVQWSSSAAQQIKVACQMWDKLAACAPVVIVSPALRARLLRENEFPLFQHDTLGNCTLWDCQLIGIDWDDATNGEYFWLANEEPMEII